MFESIEERQYLLRQEIRDDYYNLSPRERSKLSLEEYTEREMTEREGDRFWYLVSIIGLVFLLLASAISGG
jgi:hypothetical protein